MPGKRRKMDDASGKPSLESLFEEIRASLAIVKPVLAQIEQKEARDVAQALHSIAKLAESFTKLRNASDEIVAETFIDQLDVEGVGLWNMSIFMAKNDDVPTEVFAAVRYAGFRLIEAGLDANPSQQALVTILELSSKVGMAFAAVDAELADEVLTNAASYERSLNVLPHSIDPSAAQNRARATVVYYTSRMEAAWKQNNLDVATYMQKKINDHQLELLLPRDVVEFVVSKLVEIGISLLKSKDDNEADARRAQNAIPWLQRALTIVDKSSGDPVWLSGRRRAILRNLARAYYISSTDHPEHLDRTDVALKECLADLDKSEDPSIEEYQQLRWMCLALYKKRKTTNDELLKILLPLIDDSALDEDAIQDILLELRGISRSHSDIVSQALQRLLQRTLQSVDGHPVADKVLFALVMHMRTVPDHDTCINAIRAALDEVAACEGYNFDRTCAFAFLTTFWQFGDHYYDRKRWSHAADWYLLGTNPVFEVAADVTGSKCLRKAALCRINDKEYASAKILIGQCPTTEAPTCYLKFLVAVNQAQTEEAIRAVEAMIKAPDFDRKMLLLATSLARDTQNQTLLHAVLVALLDTLKVDGQEDGDQQKITLIRCMVRLVLQMMEEEGADLRRLVPILMSHLQAAHVVTSKVVKEGKELAFGNDLSWLWRSAYNAAVKGVGVWMENELTSMFGIASQLMEDSSAAALLEPETDIDSHRVIASFAHVAGQYFATRDQPQSSIRTLGLRTFTSEIDKLVTLAQKVMTSKENDQEEMKRMSHIARLGLIYKAEILSELQDWDGLINTLKSMEGMQYVLLTTYEAFADILWKNKECPVHVLYAGFETILRLSSDQGVMSVQKFSRWLRAICTILLSGGRDADRAKALAYTQQAIDLLKEHGDITDTESDQHYPDSERSWLLATAFNTGVQCTRSLQKPEAKEWFEVAIALCQFVAGSPRQKIEDTYRDLLSRY